jgi:N6-L-threonylcarbamoyladenine synthase
VLDYVGKSLAALASAYEERFGETEFIFAGGVMSNSIIKGMLKKNFNASFAEPSLSSDNAVGIAALTVREYTK